jgi:hypothetical protein
MLGRHLGDLVNWINPYQPDGIHFVPGFQYPEFQPRPAAGGFVIPLCVPGALLGAQQQITMLGNCAYRGCDGWYISPSAVAKVPPALAAALVEAGVASSP